MIKINSFHRYLLLIILLISGYGCTVIQDLSESVQKPSVSVEDVRISDFNFQRMELIYDIKIKNPNAVGVQLLSYDYQLDINENMIIQGDQAEKTTIESSGESVIQVPVSVSFTDIYNTITNIAGADSASYAFSSNLSFDLPVLGQTNLPVQKEGEIPLLKLPDVRVSNLQVKSLNLDSANLNLKLQFDNPNGFGLKVNSLNYDLVINGDTWAEGSALKNVHIKQNGVTQLNIPLTLNISRLGFSAYRILTGSKKLNFQLKGNFNLNAAHELLGKTNFNFDRSGVVSLTGT